MTENGFHFIQEEMNPNKKEPQSCMLVNSFFRKQNYHRRVELDSSHCRRMDLNSFIGG